MSGVTWVDALSSWPAAVDAPFNMHCRFHLFAAKVVSPWHEIPLFAGDGNLHYICEIPKETSAKMEVATVSTDMRF
jgi:hypothetical protein